MDTHFWGHVDEYGAIPLIEDALRRNGHLTDKQFENIYDKLGTTDNVWPAFYAALPSLLDIVEANVENRDFDGMLVTLEKGLRWSTLGSPAPEFSASFANALLRARDIFCARLCKAETFCGTVKTCLIAICSCSGDRDAAFSAYKTWDDSIDWVNA